MKLNHSIVQSIFCFVCIFFFAIAIGIAQDESSMQVHIKSFDIHGNTVIPTHSLVKVLEKYMASHFPNAMLTFADMQFLTDRITLTYKEQGYFLARCYIPKQDIKDGVLKLMVAEGVLDRIQVTGNTYYSDALLKVFFETDQPDYVINERHLEKGLLLINDLPENKTELMLTKGEKQGSVDIVLKNKDKTARQFQCSYNNYGAEILGKNRYSLSGQITDPYYGMTLRLKGISGDEPSEMFVGLAAIDLPINYYGTYANFSFMKSSAQMLQEFEPLEIEGQTKMYGVDIRHPVVLKRDLKINTYLGIYHAFSETTLLSFSSDSQIAGTFKLNGVRAGIHFDMIDHFFGKTQGECFYHVSFVDKGPYVETTNQAFQKISLSGSRIQQIKQYSHLAFRINGQWSSDKLLPLDQMAIGGYEAVRGHQPSSYLGDLGFNLSLEWMVSPNSENRFLGKPMSELIQGGIFVDHGWIHLNKEPEIGPKSKALTGYGLGLRFFYDNHFSCFTDLAFPVSPEENEDNVIFYFSAQGAF
jgi:hemolysin activation/secretion protein